jgi:uncharacterized membrane protein YidH (DUF202 family)
MNERNTTPARWYSTAAKIGLSAKGVVYCISGIIALAAALHIGNNSAKDAGKKGVFSFIENQPLGKWLLLAVAAGLICYIAWRWIQAFKDTENKGTDKKGLSKRFTYFFSGFIYSGVALYAIQSFLGTNNKNEDSRESLAAKLLEQPLGQWLAGIAGLIMIGVGIYQFYRAISGKYKKYVREALHDDAAPWIITAGIAGYSARGIVWMIIGWLFMKAALHTNSKEAGGSEKAFDWLQNSSYGGLLLGIVGAGLICYGVFMFLRAKYQHIKTA